MSLVNEALKKARLEAARQDAARRGIPLPGAPRPAAPSLGPAALFRVLLIVGVVALGVIVFFVGRRSSTSSGAASQVASQPAPVATAADPASIPAQPAPVDPPPASRAPIVEPAPPPSAPAPEPEPTPLEGRPERAAQSRVRTAWNPRSTPPPSDPASPGEPRGTAPTPQARIVVEAPPAIAAEPEPTATPAETAIRKLVLPNSVEIELGGIAWSQERPFALINGRVVGPGDRVETLTVAAIEPRHVELRGPEKRYVLRLK